MLKIIKPKNNKRVYVNFFDIGISAGFPSPAEDFIESPLSLDEKFIKNKEATFFAYVEGNSMKNAGIENGDLLIIDRSINPKDGHIAVCYLEGEFTLKRLSIKNREILLVPENEDYPVIEIKPGDELTIWGVVRSVVKSLI